MSQGVLLTGAFVKYRQCRAGVFPAGWRISPIFRFLQLERRGQCLSPLPTHEVSGCCRNYLIRSYRCIGDAAAPGAEALIAEAKVTKRTDSPNIFLSHESPQHLYPQKALLTLHRIAGVTPHSIPFTYNHQLNYRRHEAPVLFR